MDQNPYQDDDDLDMHNQHYQKVIYKHGKLTQREMDCFDHMFIFAAKFLMHFFVVIICLSFCWMTIIVNADGVEQTAVQPSIDYLGDVIDS